MTLPADPPTAAPSWLLEPPLAHRGLHDGGVPENSLAAFCAAVEAGYGAELDVHLSADGHPMVVHDADLARVAADERRVGDLTAEELGHIPLDGTDETVPTLRAALEVLRDVPVMVELKSPRIRAGALEAAVADVVEDHAGPVCVASFNPWSLRWLRRNRPAVVRVLTASAERMPGLGVLLGDRFADLRDLPKVDPVAVSYDIHGLPRPAVDAWRERGGAVVTWTVDDQASWDKARAHADNIIFEDIRPAP